MDRGFCAEAIAAIRIARTPVLSLATIPSTSWRRVVRPMPRLTWRPGEPAR